MTSRLAFVSVVLATLACGGAVDVGAHLDEACSEGPLPAPTVELAEVRGKGVLPEGAPFLEVGVGWMELDHQRLGSAQLADSLTETAAVARDLAARTGSEDPAIEGQLNVALDRRVTGKQLVELLKVAVGVGFDELHLVVSTGDVHPPPVYADPSYAATLEADLTGRSAEERQVVLASEASSLATFCPGLQKVYEAVGHASADMQCQLLVAGMEEALPECPFTDGAKVVTLMQLEQRPPTEEILATLPFTWTEDAEPLTVDPDASWDEIALQLKAAGREKMRLSL